MSLLTHRLVLAGMGLLGLLAASCSADPIDDGGISQGADGGFSQPGADASSPVEGTPDAGEPTVECSVDTFSDFGTHPGYDLFTNFNPPDETWHVFYDVDPAEEWLGALYFHKGVGIFADGVKPGKYEIAGPETSYADCAMCVFIQSRTGTIPDDIYRYFAVSGTVHIDSVDEDTDSIVGRMVEVEFRGVEYYEEYGESCVDSDQCGNAFCAGNGQCFAQSDRPELCGFSIGLLEFAPAP